MKVYRCHRCVDEVCELLISEKVSRLIREQLINANETIKWHRLACPKNRMGQLIFKETAFFYDHDMIGKEYLTIRKIIPSEIYQAKLWDGSLHK